MSNRHKPTTAICFLLIAVAAIGVGCTSEGLGAANAANPEAYRSDLAALCTASQAEQAALAPPDDSNVATFAASIGDILTRQTEAARSLRPPADLDDDHRAFVQNTADQANGWTKLAATAPTDTEQFGELQTTILQLTLGRDDLAESMQVPACRVQGS